MASIRRRERDDGTVALSVLFGVDGRQSSLTFDDEKAAESFRLDVEVNGPHRALDRRV